MCDVLGERGMREGNNGPRIFKVQQKAPAERKLEKKTFFFTSRAIRSNITIDDKTELCCGSRVVVRLLTSSDEWKKISFSVPIGNGLALFATTFYVHVSLKLFFFGVPGDKNESNMPKYIIVRSSDRQRHIPCRLSSSSRLF